MVRKKSRRRYHEVKLLMVKSFNSVVRYYLALDLLHLQDSLECDLSGSLRLAHVTMARQEARLLAAAWKQLE